MSRQRVLRLAVPLVVAALPWTWFLLRDSLGVVGDAVAILFTAIVAVFALVFGVVALRRRIWLLPMASVVAMGVTGVVGPWLPADAGPVAPGTGLVLVATNVQGQSRANDAILAHAPDVLVVSEADERAGRAFNAAFPNRAADHSGPRVAVYSRYPLRELESGTPDLPGLRLEVSGPSGPFVLYALHVPRPWPTGEGEGFQTTAADHHRIMALLAQRVRTETLPVVVAGDLNSSDRGRDYRAMIGVGGLVDAARADAATFTSVAQWFALLLRIDHVFVSPGWCGDGSDEFALPGSDHRGVVVTIGRCG